MEKYLWLHDDCVPTKYTLVQDYFTVGRAINVVTVHKLGRGRQNTWDNENSLRENVTSTKLELFVE